MLIYSAHDQYDDMLLEEMYMTHGLTLGLKDRISKIRTVVLEYNLRNMFDSLEKLPFKKNDN